MLHAPIPSQVHAQTDKNVLLPDAATLHTFRPMSAFAACQGSKACTPSRAAMVFCHGRLVLSKIRFRPPFDNRQLPVPAPPAAFSAAQCNMVCSCDQARSQRWLIGLPGLMSSLPWALALALCVVAGASAFPCTREAISQAIAVAACRC